MKKLIVLALLTVCISCADQGNSSYETNVETVKKFLQLQASESGFEDQLEMIHPEVMWQPAFHGAVKLEKKQWDSISKDGKMPWKVLFILQRIIYQVLVQIRN